MFKNGVLTINHDTWKDGIAASPFVGCGDLRNADIWSKPGALLCGRAATLENGEIFADLPTFMRHNESTDRTYAGDDDGNLYIRSAAGSWSVTSFIDGDECKGLELWKGHILFADHDVLHVIVVDGASIGFVYDDWQTFAEGQRNNIDLPHVSKIGQDDVVYFADGRYVASLQEVAGKTFDPDDNTTYTWNDQALDLPEGYVASTLSELGEYLVVGTYYSEVLNRGNRAEFFPWNRTASSFNIPLRTKGNGVWQSIAQGNVLYSIVDRRNAKLYASNLTLLELQREVRRIEAELTLHPDAIEVFEEEILAGLGDINASNVGVYSFRDNVMQLRNVLSPGDEDVEIGSILNIGDGKVLVSWQKGEQEGVDVISDERYTDYATRLDTPMYTVGTALNPVSFTQIDVLLARKLQSGQGVRVYYRTSLEDDFTLLGTYDFATYGAESAINETSNLDKVTTIQLRIELTAAADSTDSPELLSVSLF